MDHLEQLRSFIGREFTDSPSPFMKWLGPVVLDTNRGAVVFQYLVSPEWLNLPGNLHGDVTAAIIDDIIGATMFTLNKPFFYSTINNVIDYFSSAMENDSIIAETSLVKEGKQFITAHCNIWNADRSRLLARGYSNLFKNDHTKKAK